MIKIDACGEKCPIPVIKAKNAIKELTDGDALLVLVDNEIATQNLEKMAKVLNYKSRVNSIDSENYEVYIYRGTYEINLSISQGSRIESEPELPIRGEVSLNSDFIVVIPSDKMGDGDEELGKALMKAFIYSLNELETVPEKIIFYNRGAFIPTETADSISDLKSLESKGTEIMTCGACLNYYGLTDKLAVGTVTNMYAILSGMAAAGKVIKP